MQPKVLTFTECHSDGVKLKLGPTKCFIRFYLFCLYGLLLQILSHSIMLSVVWLRKRQPTIFPFCTATFLTVTIILTLTHRHSVDAALQLSSFQNSNFMNKKFRGLFKLQLQKHEQALHRGLIFFPKQVSLLHKLSECFSSSSLFAGSE